MIRLAVVGKRGFSFILHLRYDIRAACEGLSTFPGYAQTCLFIFVIQNTWVSFCLFFSFPAPDNENFHREKVQESCRHPVVTDELN